MLCYNLFRAKEQHTILGSFLHLKVSWYINPRFFLPTLRFLSPVLVRGVLTRKEILLLVSAEPVD